MFNALIDFDTACFYKINRLQANNMARRICRVLSFSGDGYFYPLLALWLCWVRAEYALQYLLSVFTAFMIDLPSFMMIKKWVKRPRPFQVHEDCLCAFQPADHFSMPSGHAAAAALIAFHIYFFYPLYGFVAIVWAFLVGFSRVLLGVHYPLDVFAGFILGVGCSLFAMILV